MMDSSFFDKLISALPKSLPGLFNPWDGRCVHDHPDTGPQERIERLRRHLDCKASLILVGEAPGYQGCRYSGVAFTSERLLLDGVVPRMPPSPIRLTTRALPFSEPSATIVWKTLYRLGLADTTIMWNAVQLHPHKIGDPWTNRTPTDAEISLGQPALKILVDAYPCARLVAVGRKAEAALDMAGISAFASIRHPANGGAKEFSDGLTRLVTRFV